MHRLIFAFFLLSGFSSLVFEVIWSRMLQQVFGTTSFAISTLLTAFMAGLAIGSWLGGKIAARMDDQLKVYGLLEASVGLYALAVPLVLDLLPRLYGLLFEHFIEDFVVFSLLRFVAVFAILVVPTTLMGATLPLVSQWIADRQRLFQGSIGLLYGANTFGACVGCLVAGFWLLPTLGLSTTNTLFGLASLTLGAIIVASSGPLAATGTSGPVSEDVDDPELAGAGVATSRAKPHPKWALYAALVAFGLTGVVAMAYQVLWTRAYLIALGSSTYSFTLVLAAVLAGISLGSAAVSPLVKRIARPLLWFGLVQFGVAATAVLSFFVLDSVPVWLFELVEDSTPGVAEIFSIQFGLVALVVLIPSFLQGTSFPLVVRAVTYRAEQTGADVGNAYAYNTTGAIVGSFVAGFVLLPWLGLQGAVAATIALNFAVATGLAATELTLSPRRRSIAVLAVGAAAAVGLWALAPPLDRARLTSGVFRIEMARDVIDDGFEDYDPEILYYEDGLTATTSVERHGDTLTLKANGKPEASDGADMPTQILVGLMPFVVRSGWTDVDPGGERAAMIGYGSGVTAGASLQWPLDHLEVVEIESTMVEASRHFDHVNHRPLIDDRLNLVTSDGRNYLEYHPETFDVIVSEPSNPWVAGVSSLFTVEFFERARSRLADDGVFAQWVQLYEMRPDNVRTVVETFRSVFPHVMAFSTQPKSAEVVLIGSERPLAMPPEGYRAGREIESVHRELGRADLQTVYDIYGLLFMNESQLAEFAAGAELNTDDNGLLEYSAPRDLFEPHAGREFFTEWYFETDDYGDPRPHLTDWPTGWNPEQVGQLAVALWRSGKPVLARQILADAELESPGPDHPPIIDDMHKVLDAADTSLSSVIHAHWPQPDSEFHDRARAALQSAELRSRDLDRLDDPPPAEVETALYHLVLLVRDRRYSAAERRLDDLAESDHLADEPLYQFLRADILEVRRRYHDAFEAYLEYAKAN